MWLNPSPKALGRSGKQGELEGVKAVTYVLGTNVLMSWRRSEEKRQSCLLQLWEQLLSSLVTKKQSWLLHVFWLQSSNHPHFLLLPCGFFGTCKRVGLHHRGFSWWGTDTVCLLFTGSHYTGKNLVSAGPLFTASLEKRQGCQEEWKRGYQT